MNYGAGLMAELLRFHPHVADDLRSAIEWYDRISVELGNRFRRAVDARLDDVASRPKSFGLIDEVLRAARVNKFPYLIIFNDTGSATEVLGVHHTASDPENWRRRTRS